LIPKLDKLERRRLAVGERVIGSDGESDSFDSSVMTIETEALYYPSLDRRGANFGRLKVTCILTHVVAMQRCFHLRFPAASG